MSENNEIQHANILVIDDEALNLVLIEEFFQYEGFTNVILFSDPVKALTHFENELVDIILLDLKMPVLDGYEFIEKAQALEKKCPPILVLTASADNKTHSKVMQANAQGLISKPFDFDDVLLQMKKLLSVN